MSKNKNVLGRGLSAILRNSQTDITSNKKHKPLGNISDILIQDIEINPFQPRNKFNKDDLQELALSIQELGVIQPITVRKLGFDKYQLISGERRLRASQIVGLNKIPGFIRIANDEQMLEMSLVENIQRKDLDPIEIALSFKRLIDECNLTQEACSQKVGKKRSTITNFLRLLKLPKEIQTALKQKKISTGHARALINISKKEKQLNIYYDIIENGLSVREVEQIVKTFSKHEYKRILRPHSITHTIPFLQQKRIHELSNYFKREIGLKTNKKGGGKIIIPFKCDDDLKKLLLLMKLDS